MNRNRTIQFEHHISYVLHTYFDVSFASVKAIIEPSCLSVFLSDFVMPFEKTLLKRSETEQVLKIRGGLMRAMEKTLKKQAKKTLGILVTDLSVTWNLEEETGHIVFGLCDEIGSKAVPTSCPQQYKSRIDKTVNLVEVEIQK
ncbi:Na-translocating system protein MpsC family protein [Planomicrobium sp. CPCC 101110]|uniref:Na-translocating system protein MpsC family protein n=1 Tax=Planomicrobium sp. CPCC 101110 TaxID=2599619 RepID=UPI0011B36BA0|nr:Na-translocating system protein MpsC family protein [Planomicrobium sp. CPCC 101110]TWT25806.1 DUF2294 family protein [Planomicrobium sp. CPCC 101110]